MAVTDWGWCPHTLFTRAKRKPGQENNRSPTCFIDAAAAAAARILSSCKWEPKKEVRTRPCPWCWPAPAKQANKHSDRPRPNSCYTFLLFVRSFLFFFFFLLLLLGFYLIVTEGGPHNTTHTSLRSFYRKKFWLASDSPFDTSFSLAPALHLMPVFRKIYAYYSTLFFDRSIERRDVHQHVTKRKKLQQHEPNRSRVVCAARTGQYNKWADDGHLATGTLAVQMHFDR